MSGLFSSAFGYGPTQYSDDATGWLSRLVSGRGQNTGATRNLSVAYACRKQISESLSIFPIQIVKKISQNKREIDDKHPVHNLLNLAPNRIMTAVKFRQAQTLNILDEGDSYAEIEFEKGGSLRPKYLWPLPPGTCFPEVFYNSSKIDIRYRVRLPDGTEKILSKNRVLHIVGMSNNGFKGQGVLEAAAKTLNLGSDLEEFASKFFTNGSNGGGWATIPADMKPETGLKVRKKLEIMNGGMENAHRLKLLMDGVTYSESTIKNDQAQFLESRTFQIQEVARFYGMPLHKIQETSNGSYNSYEQLAIEYINYTLQPFVRAWEQEIQRKLFRDSKDKDYTVRFNLNALLRGDSKARANFYRTMIYTGILTRNEIRAMEDWSHKDGADELLIPTNLITQEAAEKAAKGDDDDDNNLSDKALDGQERTID